MSAARRTSPSIADYIGRSAPADRVMGGRALSRSASAAPPASLVSIVTVSFNSVRTIDRTIDSIVAQDHQPLEYVIVDGGSTDGTIDRLRARSADIDFWISERDAGISDAFNKGIALSTGEYVALVNADDWLERDHLACAVRVLRNAVADFVFGDLVFHPLDARRPYVIEGERQYERRVAHAMPHINHPTVVCRRAVYETHGLYDTGLAVAMDYEWLLRGFRQGVRGAHVPGLTSHMSMNGVSDRNYVRGYREVRDVSIRYGYPALLAHLRYAGRRCRTVLRRGLAAGWLPEWLYEGLRRAANAHYRAGHMPVRSEHDR